MGETRRSLLLAVAIVGFWVGSLMALLPTSFQDFPPWLVGAFVILRTFVQTGLFIVAHDAMHGTLWPERPRMNRQLGQMALVFYAALPYGKCCHNHGRHHRHAGTPDDPDHHGVGGESWFQWYAAFMASYLSTGQLAALVGFWLCFASLASLASPSPMANVALYCILPTLLSSLQLFLVGTFLPHRTIAGGTTTDSHQPFTLALPTWLSFLSCYHFGYHWEHHAFPHLPWHALPKARRQGAPRPIASKSLPSPHFTYQSDKI